MCPLKEKFSPRRAPRRRGIRGRRAERRVAPWKLLERPINHMQLRTFVRRHFGLTVPRVSVCEGHDSPMDYLAHGFRLHGEGALVWACRGGSKTMLAAVLTVIESLFRPGLETYILGGSLAQSSYMYEYVRKFLARPSLEGLARSVTRTRATLANGSRIHILPQSQRSVRGVHVPRLRLDEIEEFRGDVFEAACFVPQSTDDARARLEILSTCHRPYGLMSDLVDAHEAKGLRLFQWCLWEIIERCYGRSCDACALREDCGGKAKRAWGFLSIDDAIARKRLVSDEAWQSEMLCKRPSREGLFYRAFDERVHVPREPIRYDPNCELYRAFDWGVNGWTVCLWIQVDGDGRVRVIDEFYQRETAVSDMARKVLDHEADRGYGKALRSYCDPSGASYMLEFRKAGIVCEGRREDGGRANVRFEGFEAVRRFLKLDRFGKPKLLVSPACERTRHEFRTYHYPRTRDGRNPTEEPAKVNDHAMDALRYFFVSRFPEEHWQMV